MHYYSFPGGGVDRNEPFLEAAVRELREEVALEVSKGSLDLDVIMHHQWDGKQDHVEVYRYECSEFPRVRIDNREVVKAEFVTPEEALRHRLFRPARKHIEQEMARQAAAR